VEQSFVSEKTKRRHSFDITCLCVCWMLIARFIFQSGKSSPTSDQQVGPIPSSEDDEPGITFEATPRRGVVGRYPSFDNNDGDVEQPRYFLNFCCSCLLFCISFVFDGKICFDIEYYASKSTESTNSARHNTTSMPSLGGRILQLVLKLCRECEIVGQAYSK